MSANRVLHVLVNKKGKIVAAGYLEPQGEGEERSDARIIPMKGQRLIEVFFSEELGTLESEEDFARLT
ncbi:MAG: hypothetical protein WCA32_15250 [Chromatiaceae bacterium]|jgi:hypothetical protein